MAKKNKEKETRILYPERKVLKEKIANLFEKKGCQAIDMGDGNRIRIFLDSIKNDEGDTKGAFFYGWLGEIRNASNGKVNIGFNREIDDYKLKLKKVKTNFITLTSYVIEEDNVNYLNSVIPSLVKATKNLYEENIEEE